MCPVGQGLESSPCRPPILQGVKLRPEHGVGKRVRSDWRWMTKPGQDVGVQRAQGKAFPCCPTPLAPGSGRVGRPATNHHFFPPAHVVGLRAGGGGYPTRRAGDSLLLALAGPGPTGLKMYLMKKNKGAHCPVEPLVSGRPGSLLPSLPSPVKGHAYQPKPRDQNRPSSGLFQGGLPKKVLSGLQM